MKRALALLALAGLALTGCAALTEVPAPAATSAAATTTASSAAATATVADYIAGTTAVRRDTQEWIDTYSTPNCRAGSFQDDPLCSAPIVIAEMQASTAGLVISGLNNPKNPNYVGAPPTEIAAHVKAAVATAAEIEKNAAAINDDNCHETLGCGTHWWDVNLGMQELADELESWAAYN